MSTAHILGFPRIGEKRELKLAQEAFWKGQIDEAALQQVGSDLRARHWAWQRDAGLDRVTVGDFAWYDQVQSTLALLGALPARFQFDAKRLSLSDYFAAARGTPSQAAMEMTKWFDTNYHYLVPEWQPDSDFSGGVEWLFEEIAQAQSLGHTVKPVLIGPVSLLFLGKAQQDRPFDKLTLLPKLLHAYSNILKRMQALKIEWLQIDEPILALELSPAWRAAFASSYAALSPHAPKILLATYFDSVAEHSALLHSLPIAGLHLDLVRAPQQLATMLVDWPAGRVLSAGVIDGRNIWRADLSQILARLQPLQQRLGDALWLASSCSLLHVPVDLAIETRLDSEMLSWLAFAKQKLAEISALQAALRGESNRVIGQFTSAQVACHSRRTSKRIHNEVVQQALQKIQPQDAERASPYVQRNQVQQARFQLPLFPTTTIGSFPQTKAIRAARAAHKRGTLGPLDYLEAMRKEIDHVIATQEEIGLDVLVHGEAERNDMVEYFGEQLWGYAFSEHGWVQSYGSRCVKPPIIYGDVYRAEAMTVEWSRYAQSRSSKPVKGMLTGPVTMLQWSFVRDDQARSQTALQIALALRDEVRELEKAGICMIQIDEPALREGLPLKQSQWPEYLSWAVHAFKLCAAKVRDETQIHTHMCYSEFQDILPWIAALDADVITIETSRSKMELLDAFAQFAYPNQIGPGVYDIHSPTVPSILQMQQLLEKARSVIPDAQLWVNPDCGLKTRDWPETLAALKNMVAAAKLLRESAVHEEAACCATH